MGSNKSSVMQGVPVLEGESMYLKTGDSYLTVVKLSTVDGETTSDDTVPDPYILSSTKVKADATRFFFMSERTVPKLVSGHTVLFCTKIKNASNVDVVHYASFVAQSKHFYHYTAKNTTEHTHVYFRPMGRGTKMMARFNIVDSSNPNLEERRSDTSHVILSTKKYILYAINPHKTLLGVTVGINSSGRQEVKDSLCSAFEFEFQ